MPITPLPSPSPQTLLRRALDNLKLRPKLKLPSKDALPPDDLPVTPTDNIAFKKQIMGFREWCEKFYDQRNGADC